MHAKVFAWVWVEALPCNAQCMNYWWSKTSKYTHTPTYTCTHTPTMDHLHLFPVQHCSGGNAMGAVGIVVIILSAWHATCAANAHKYMYVYIDVSICVRLCYVSCARMSIMQHWWCCCCWKPNTDASICKLHFVHGPLRQTDQCCTPTTCRYAAYTPL